MCFVSINNFVCARACVRVYVRACLTRVVLSLLFTTTVSVIFYSLSSRRCFGFDRKSAFASLSSSPRPLLPRVWAVPGEQRSTFHT